MEPQHIFAFGSFSISLNNPTKMYLFKVKNTNTRTRFDRGQANSSATILCIVC